MDEIKYRGAQDVGVPTEYFDRSFVAVAKNSLGGSTPITGSLSASTVGVGMEFSTYLSF